jgi:hypothetical protein
MAKPALATPDRPRRVSDENDRLADLRSARAKVIAEWNSVEAAIAAIEGRQAARARERTMTMAAARGRAYRDGTPRDSAEHREIARRYAWYAYKGGKTLPSRIDPARPGGCKLLTLIRLRELERIFSSRYGAVLPDDDSGRDDVQIAAHHIAHMGPDAERHIAAWAGLWAPWMPADEVAALVARVIARPIKFLADTLGWRLRLSRDERHELAITTIGAFDQNAEARKTFRKLKRRMAERRRRRAKGAKSREAYESRSLAKGKPWEALGMSRRTWYRRGRPSPPAPSPAGGSHPPKAPRREGTLPERDHTATGISDRIGRGTSARPAGERILC